MKCKCELCAFGNPKPTATAVIIAEGKLLVVKRHDEPFAGKWDFVGGYLAEGETPEMCLRREIKEELGLSSALTFIGSFTGEASYKDYTYPIVSFTYLTEINGTITLNEELESYAWIPIPECNDVAFDSNQKILAYVKKNLYFPVVRVRELIQQLDHTAVINEGSLYKAVLNGYVSKVYEEEKLVGMGWIFPRETLLRRQAVIEDMIVDEAYRGRGFGKKILADLVSWAKKNGVGVLELTSNPKRIAANALYKSFGFVLHETNHYLYFLRD